ncbi:HAD family hydrolase [Aurantibacter sp.]|uniref:HAD family hydrolase n=1 Tax=Aurantibacter sp. TaxID=2807103 RepID=UPI0035C7D7FE
MLKAILFDMDGVIVDTEPLHHKAYYKMFNDYKMPVTSEFYEGLTGKSTKNVCNILIENFNPKATALELELCKRSHFNNLFDFDESLKLLPGVLELIQDYHKNGLTLVLASSASMGTIEKVFNRFNLDQYFVAKLSGADLKASKPHPEIFEKAAKAANQNPENCIVIEDSTNGIKAAKSANIYCIGYNSLNSKNQDYTKADLVVTNFSDIHYAKIVHILD